MHRITLHVSERGGLVGHLGVYAQDNITCLGEGRASRLSRCLSTG